MTKNPTINALGAGAYIAVVVGVMNFVTRNLKDKPDTIFAPMAVLSLLTLSVTVMAYAFFYQPLQLFIAGEKKEAVNLFIQTVGVFGAITALVLALLFSGLG